MTKLFKNNKKVLSCVLAFAVLAVSLFTGVAATHIHADAAAADEGTIDLLEFGDYLVNDLGSTSKWYDNKLADNGETGADWDNAIIIDSAEELVYLCKASGNDTIGKYYKVADGIAGFNLATASLDIDGTLADNVDIIKGSGKNHSGGTPGFQGHFDGNGATVYGAWTNHNAGQVSPYAALFSCAKGEITIKNIHVNKAHFTATTAAAGILGFHSADDMCTVTIENCSVTDSYFEVNASGWGKGVGAIIGRGASAPAKRETTDNVDYNGDGDTADTIYVNVAYIIKNCYVNLDADNFVTVGGFAPGTVEGQQVCRGGVVGVCDSNALAVSDSVVIGITPYATSISNNNNAVQHSGLEDRFANVYTTSDVPVTGVTIGGTLTNRNFTGKVISLSDAQLKGAAAIENMDLDWSVWMADANGYPELASAHKNITLVDKEDGTHAATCACGFGGIAVDHTFADGVCACGAELNCATRKTITWDGSVATGIATGAGTKDNPYVIKSAAELAWLVQQKAEVTTDKYYEIDPAIGAIVLQSDDKADAIKALDSAAATKAYFEAGSFTPWKTMGWEGSCFAGQLDGNGATIYGMYAVSTNNAALFCTVDGGAAIKNIAVKNSYLTSSAPDYQVGALIGTTSSVGYGAKRQSVIWVSDVVVANNYMYNASTAFTRSGVIGTVQDAITIDNCLVYGNDATYGSAVKMPLLGNSTNAVEVTDTLFEGFEPKTAKDGERMLYVNVVRNSVVLGADLMNTKDSRGWRKNDPACYENCYTDSASGTVAFSSGEWTYTEEQIKAITKDDLATLELGDAWITTDTYPELKAFHDAVFSGDPTASGAAGHAASCSCGLADSNLQPHKFVTDVEPAEWDSYYCEVCNYVCEHVSEEEGLVEYEGDCLTAAGYTYDCPICGYHEEAFEEIAGHSFTSNDAEAGADCQTPGTIAHKYCTSCEKNYAADADKLEPFENALTDLTGEKGECVPNKDDSGIVYGADDNNHWTTCATCGEKIETTAHTGVITPNGAAGHKVVCDVCKYESDNAEHAFGDDNKCDTCDWECTNHVWVDDGEPVEVGYMEKTETLCKKQAQKCEICGIAGPDKEIGHTTGDWEINNNWDPNKVYTCEGDGQHTEYLICTVCMFTVEEKIVTDPKTGHSFTDIAEEAPTCTTVGTIAHKQCSICGGLYATDAASDEPSANQLNPFDGSMDIAVDPENHVWIEYGEDATCEKDGVVDHKFCFECLLLVIDGEESEITIDANAVLSEFYDNYSKYDYEAYLAFVAENYADLGLELPAEYPAEDASDEEWMAFNEAYYGSWDVLYETDPTWNEAYGDYQTAYTDAILADMAYDAFVVAMEEAEVDLVVPAKGHTLTKVDEVAATYDKDGTKAHYACECGKLYSDAEGKNEVTAESLVIARLVKEEEKPADKPAGDGSTTSPVTGESVASVAAVAALVGAAFVLVRKSKKA